MSQRITKSSIVCVCVATCCVAALLLGCSGGSGDDTGSTSGEVSDELQNAECPNVPYAPLLSPIHAGATLEFETRREVNFRVGLSTDVNADEPDQWQDGPSLTLPDEAGSLKLFAETVSDDCDAGRFEAVVEVTQSYPSAANTEGTHAIGIDEDDWLGWATDYDEPDYGDEAAEMWRTPEKALGEATGDPLDVVSLGEGGTMVLHFEPPIANGSGPDFAVFENSFNDSFLELAMIEVSSDGEHYARFASAYLSDTPVDRYGTHQTTDIGGLAGKYRAGYGTPFDLELLRFDPLVQLGLVNIDHVTQVRVVDVVGDGSTLDSFGHSIYDPVDVTESGGFDLEAIGVLHQSE